MILGLLSTSKQHIQHTGTRNIYFDFLILGCCLPRMNNHSTSHFRKTNSIKNELAKRGWENHRNFNILQLDTPRESPMDNACNIAMILC